VSPGAQIARGPRVTLWKHGGDTLAVDSLTVITEVGGPTLTIDQGDGERLEYSCGNLTLQGDCSPPVRQEPRAALPWRPQAILSSVARGVKPRGHHLQTLLEAAVA
jgi:hypothetical protein